MNYKRLYILILTLTMLLSVSGCKKDFTSDIPNHLESSQDKSISHSYTSSDGDIVHEELIFEASGWVYYTNPNDSSALYKRKLNNSSNLKIREGYFGVFCLEGDWIYYSEYEDNNSLYRIKTDGSIKEKLNNDDSTSINVSKEWVYYKNSSDNDTPYRIKKDGSERTKLGEDPVWSIYVAGGDWVYYANSSENNNIYRIGMDGRERTKITNANTNNYCVSGDWVYYVKGETETTNYPQIYKIKRDGTEETHLKNGESHELFTDFAVIGDYLYYDTYNSDDVLYRIKTDGTEPERISAEGEYINSLNVSKDGILFNSTFYGLNICRMDLESKSETIIDRAPKFSNQHLAEWIFYNDKNGDLGPNIYINNMNTYNVLTERITSELRILEDTAYFLVKSGDYSSLYKQDIYKPEPKMLAGGKIVTFDIAGDIIYYSDAGDNTICSIKTDGSEKKELFKRRADYLQIDKEWIYLTFDSPGIYRIKTDGTGGHFLFSNVWVGNRFIISGDWIYFGDNTGLSKIKTDGTKITKLFDVDIGIGKLLSLKDDRMYFETIIAEGPEQYGWVSGFYSIKLDGTGKETLLEGTINSWAVVDDTVYYNKIIRDINIIKTRLDGTGRQVLVPDLEWH